MTKTLPIDVLRDPAKSLPAFGHVMDQKTDVPIKFDAYAITERLQATIVSYASKPPRDDHGFTKLLALLGYRQGGKSTTVGNAFYPLAAYTPGWDHITFADTKWRAEYLHKRLHYLHQRWPEDIRTPTVHSRESRQLTFNPRVGGTMRTLSLESNATGIGQSPNSVHVSETPFCSFAAEQWSYLQPAVINKKEVRVIFEATPAPADQPSVEFWRETCVDAKLGLGRWIYAFFPFWDGKLNRRPWGEGDVLSVEESRLMEKYHHLGLKKENLAFRRLMIDTDKQLRRNPDMFNVWYPFDDVSCWIGATKSVLPSHALERHQNSVLIPKNKDYVQYKKPRSGAMYVIGVDPAGFAARDHASFQVLEVWEDRWEQVAHYSAHEGDPDKVSSLVLRAAKEYNNALIVVETNGVGVATFAAIRRTGYINLYYEKLGKPGWTSTTKSNEESLGWLVDALMDKLIIHCEQTLDQLNTYKSDKSVEQTARQEQVRSGRPLKGRRGRHHWDSVSALIFAIVGARRLPQHRRPELPPEGVDKNVKLFGDMTWNEVEEHRKLEAAELNRHKRTRRGYVSIRKHRRR